MGKAIAPLVIDNFHQHKTGGTMLADPARVGSVIMRH